MKRLKLTTKEIAWAKRVLMDSVSLESFLHDVDETQRILDRDESIIEEMMCRRAPVKENDILQVTPINGRRFWFVVTHIHASMRNGIWYVRGMDTTKEGRLRRGNQGTYMRSSRYANQHDWDGGRIQIIKRPLEED